MASDDKPIAGIIALATNDMHWPRDAELLPTTITSAALRASIRLVQGPSATIRPEITLQMSGKAIELMQSRVDEQSFVYLDNMAKSREHGAKVWLSMTKDIIRNRDTVKILDQFNLKTNHIHIE